MQTQLCHHNQFRVGLPVFATTKMSFPCRPTPLLLLIEKFLVCVRLALCMTTISQVCLSPMRAASPLFSVLPQTPRWLQMRACHKFPHKQSADSNVMTDGAPVSNMLVECSAWAKLTPPHVRGLRFLSGGSLDNGPRRSQTRAPCKSPCEQSSNRNYLTNSAPMNNALVGYGNFAELNPPLFRSFKPPSDYSLEKGLQRRRKVAKSPLRLSTACAVNPGVVIVPERFATNFGVDLPVFTDTRMSFIVASHPASMD